MRPALFDSRISTTSSTKQKKLVTVWDSVFVSGKILIEFAGFRSYEPILDWLLLRATRSEILEWPLDIMEIVSYSPEYDNLASTISTHRSSRCSAFPRSVHHLLTRPFFYAWDCILWVAEGKKAAQCLILWAPLDIKPVWYCSSEETPFYETTFKNIPNMLRLPECSINFERRCRFSFSKLSIISSAAVEVVVSQVRARRPPAPKTTVHLLRIRIEHASWSVTVLTLHGFATQALFSNARMILQQEVFCPFVYWCFSPKVFVLDQRDSLSIIAFDISDSRLFFRGGCGLHNRSGVACL